MRASQNGHHDIVRTLLEAEADLNAKDNVRNQMMMMMMIIMIMIIIVLTILMMMMIIIVLTI
jgi:hypothetical protein